MMKTENYIPPTEAVMIATIDPDHKQFLLILILAALLLLQISSAIWAANTPPICVSITPILNEIK